MDAPGRFDTLVIGGGPAGLTGAIYLGRFRRRTLVIDAGHSRAVRIPRSHNMPGYPEGVVGAELVAAMREQAERYGATFASGCVERLERTPDGFEAAWEGGSARADTVLLATGASDVEPAMPYVADALRSGLLRYCPVCDGFEVIGLSVGVLADGPKGFREALYLRDFTDRLTIFPVGADLQPSVAEREALDRAGIVLARGPVHGIRHWNACVTLRHGPPGEERETACDALYGALGLRIRSELAGEAERDEDGYLLTDRHQQTSIEGLYAAGDVCLGVNQISVATGGAAIAATAIHQALRRRDAAAHVTG